MISKHKKIEEPNQDIYLNAPLETIEPIGSKKEISFFQIKEANHNATLNKMQESVNNFIFTQGAKKLEQSPAFLEEVKEKIEIYQTMNNNNTIKKTNYLDTSKFNDKRNKKIVKLLASYFESFKNVDFEISEGKNSLLKEFHQCLFEPEQMQIELTFEENIIPVSFIAFNDRPDLKQLIQIHLRIMIHDCTKVPLKNIVFLNFRKGSVKVKYLITNIPGQNNQAAAQSYQNSIRDTFKREYGDSFSGVDLKLISFMRKLALSEKDFDPAGNFHFPCPKGDLLKRGNHYYYQPNNQWKRYGLKVTALYTNDIWLGCLNLPGEWAVAFHGPRNASDEGIKNMIQTKNIKPGMHNAYAGGETGTPRKRKIPKGVYLAWNVEDSYTKAVELKGKRYEISFQCRVRPDKIFQTSHSSYIVIEKSKYIRPYGIVIKNLGK